MSQRQVLQVFDQYQKSRVQFVQTVAELSNRPQNIETLLQCGVLSLLRPLLLDVVPNVQQNAAIAIGRLANHSEELASAVVKSEILPQLVYSISEQNRFYKKAAAFVLRSVAKHSAELAEKVVESGALDSLVSCLEEFDVGVKENAAWSLGYIARHNANLSQMVVDAGSIPLLILCLQEPDNNLKRAAASSLGDIAKHTPDLAQSVIDAGAIAYLSKHVTSTCPKLKRQAFASLAQIAKHTADFADLVVESEIFPAILISLKDKDEGVRKECATLIREICKHTLELSQLIVNSGGAAAIVDYIGESYGNASLPGIMALGYIAAHSERLAMAIIHSLGIAQLKSALVKENEEHVKAAIIWSIGHIGRHSSTHAKAVADAGLLPIVLACYCRSNSSEDLQTKAKRCLKQVLQKVIDIEALEPLLQDSPPNILKHVVAQFSKILPKNANARRAFVLTGGLKKIQEIQAEPGSDLAESIDAINNCFPEDVVKYYSPGYPEALLERVEAYQLPT
uniref:Sperm-associated antigen 6 n=1 Tax=Schistocephalus solidus TaxID=70667 RepID=A0A0X3PL50_SCHSO